MGRFGNVMLVAGEADLSLEAKRGEVVRLYLTNTANTRVFNVALPGARMKLVGGDSGHYEREEFVDELLLAPSERVVVDVLFGEPGQLDARAPDAGPPYRLATSPSPASRPRPCSWSSSNCCGRTPTWRPCESESPIPGRPCRQDARVRRRDGPGHARGHRCSCTRAPCTRRSSVRSPGDVRSAV